MMLDVGVRQSFVKVAQRELAKMRPGVHYGISAVLHTWRWCCHGLFELGRGKEALSLGLGARAAIETALTGKPEETDRFQAMKYLAELGSWLVKDERPEAEDCLQRVLVLAKELPVEERADVEGDICCLLAEVYKEKKDFCKVIHYAQRAVEVRRNGRWSFALHVREGSAPPRHMNRRIRRRRT
jgi:hypothetical protein